ncbi:hypothetical protein NL108_002798 [Boleophthalmus pectinirostris]|nr:hypothetical protein NL108_002798 [Boleophthalmus pectinirostris]
MSQFFILKISSPYPPPQVQLIRAKNGPNEGLERVWETQKMRRCTKSSRQCRTCLTRLALPSASAQFNFSPATRSGIGIHFARTPEVVDHVPANQQRAVKP